MLYNILAKNTQVKKHGYKAFDYEDDLRQEMSQVKEKANIKE